VRVYERRERLHQARRHGANNIFNPPPPFHRLTGKLYEPAMCSKRSCFNWFARTLPPRQRLRYATFPRGFMNRGRSFLS